MYDIFYHSWILTRRTRDATYCTRFRSARLTAWKFLSPLSGRSLKHTPIIELYQVAIWFTRCMEVALVRWPRVSHVFRHSNDSSRAFLCVRSPYAPHMCAGTLHIRTADRQGECATWTRGGCDQRRFPGDESASTYRSGVPWQIHVEQARQQCKVLRGRHVADHGHVQLRSNTTSFPTWRWRCP